MSFSLGTSIMPPTTFQNATHCFVTACIIRTVTTYPQRQLVETCLYKALQLLLLSISQDDNATMLLGQAEPRSTPLLLENLM